MQTHKLNERCERCKLPLCSPDASSAVPCPKCSAFVSNIALSLEFLRGAFDDVMREGERHE